MRYHYLVKNSFCATKTRASVKHPKMSLNSLSTLLANYEKQILQNTYTRADFSYHNIKQSLHNLWAKIYVLEDSQESASIMKRIHECLANLEKRVAENEQQKYLKYYVRPTGSGGRVHERGLVGNTA